MDVDEDVEVDEGIDVVVAVEVLGCGSAREVTRFGAVVGDC